MFQVNQTNNKKPIGILDSGSGGISVWSEIIKLLPKEDTIYLSDYINCPYGTKSLKNIKEITVRAVEFLLKNNSKVIVIACNTASAAAIKYLRKKYAHIPFIGMEPAIKPAIETTKTKKIAVLATSATINGIMYKNLKKQYARYDLELYSISADDFVTLVEENKLNSDYSKKIIHRVLEKHKNSKIDKIVLGCTHFPFLSYEIKSYFNNKIDVINPAPFVAKQLNRVLKLYNIYNNNGKKHLFYTSKKSTFLTDFTKKHSLDKPILIHL